MIAISTLCRSIIMLLSIKDSVFPQLKSRSSMKIIKILVLPYHSRRLKFSQTGQF